MHMRITRFIDRKQKHLSCALTTASFYGDVITNIRKGRCFSGIGLKFISTFLLSFVVRLS